MYIYIIILVQFAWVFLNYVDFKFQHASRKSMQWAPLSMSSCPFGLSKSTWHLREWQTKSHNHCWATTCTNLSLIKIYIYIFDIHNYTHVIAKTTINVWRIQLQFGKLARIGRFCADSVGMCLDQSNVGAIALPHVDNNLMWCTWQNWCWLR